MLDEWIYREMETEKCKFIITGDKSKGRVG